MKKLIIENKITTRTVTLEAKKKFPELNLPVALNEFRKLQVVIFQSTPIKNEETKKKIAEKIELSFLIIQPFLEFDVRGN